VEFEDEMVDLYPLCTFGNNPVAASIDTPLHGYLPFAHVDHLHPDWGIALAASANGKQKMEEFNAEFGHQLACCRGSGRASSWHDAAPDRGGDSGLRRGGAGRPRAVHPGATRSGRAIGTPSPSSTSWASSSRGTGGRPACALRGAKRQSRADRRPIALQIFPRLRGAVSRRQRWIGSYSELPQVLEFVNSQHAEELAQPGHELPGPLHPDQDPSDVLEVGPGGRSERAEGGDRDGARDLQRRVRRVLCAAHARGLAGGARCEPDGGAGAGRGMFSFGKNKTESRITGEFYINAIGVMQGAGRAGRGDSLHGRPAGGPGGFGRSVKTFANYVALPASEAFRIEYWKLEEAKIRRQPPEKELSRGSR